MFLDDGNGSGSKAKVDDSLRLHTRSFAISQQHAVSSADEQAYQASSVKAITNSELNILLLKNTNETKDLIVSYMQLETIGAAASNASALWKIKLGGDYASGGTAITPTNIYVGSAKAASGVFYDATASGITTSGSPIEIDRTYLANTRISYNKEGAVILPRNGVLTISHTGSTVAGTAYCRVSFYYDSREN